MQCPYLIQGGYHGYGDYAYSIPSCTTGSCVVCVCVCVYITAYVHARRARDAGGPDPLTQTSESLPHAVLTLSKQ